MPENQPQSTTPPEPAANQQLNQHSPSGLRAQSIKILRWTIHLLEKAVVKLETAPTGQETPGLVEKLQVGWSGILAKIRRVLPETLNQKLSDTALTGAIAGITTILIFTISVVGSGKPAEVAIIPNVEPPIPTPTVSTPPELTAPTAPEPIVATPIPEPAPTPPPPIELTPEQNLIASIQNQVDEISDRYGDGLIQSIQPNFENSRLIIKISDNWYNLPSSQQNKLATQILEQAKQLDFSYLEVTDLQGKLLARSPLVGKKMIILKRQV